MVTSVTTVLDVSFRIQGTWVPADHGYALFGAISRVAPDLHGDESVGVHPLRGSPSGERRLRLEPSSRLEIRVPADYVPAVLPLAGKQLEVDGATLLVGVPTVHLLHPAPVVQSRLVVIKGFTEPTPFLEAARRQLDALGIGGHIELARVRADASREGRVSRPAGAPVRRTLTIHGRQIVGFAVQVSRLEPEASVRLQAAGLGGRRRFGCGLFVPVPEEPR